MAKYEEGETGGQEIGSEGGGADLNLGTPPKSPPVDRTAPPSPARRSVKEE